MNLDELLEWERRGWQALCEGTGADFYGAMMVEDGVMVLANGALMTRDEVVESLAAAPTWDKVEFEHERMVALADGDAVLVYYARAERDGQPPFTAWMTSVYTRVDGSLRLASYQQTPSS